MKWNLARSKSQCRRLRAPEELGYEKFSQKSTESFLVLVFKKAETKLAKRWMIRINVITRIRKLYSSWALAWEIK